MSLDHRQYSPACARNRGPILEVLLQVFPSRCRVLEIASGTGEHGAFFACEQPGWSWQPSDISSGALSSIQSWVDHVSVSNVDDPISLDVTELDWPTVNPDAVFCANMIHISPWECTRGLFRGAARVLQPGSPLVTYGPYKLNGAHTAPSNAAFDDSLRRRDPTWGIRDLSDVCEVALASGFVKEQQHQMPANNLCVVFRRADD